VGYRYAVNHQEIEQVRRNALDEILSRSDDRRRLRWVHDRACGGKFVAFLRLRSEKALGGIGNVEPGLRRGAISHRCGVIGMAPKKGGLAPREP
jgi:hypothetical protein